MHNQNRLLKVLKLISSLKTTPPKSVKLLAKQFQISERTLYRYIDLIKEAGFEIEKEGANKFFIQNTDHHLASVFTVEEANYVKNILLQSGSTHILKNAILLKLNLYAEMEAMSFDISQAHASQIIKVIQNAIKNKTQVVFKSYLSVNSNTVSDRKVEPIQFTPDFNYIFGYEPESKKNKLFAIDRIKEAKTTSLPHKFTDKHQFKGLDIFNFNNSGTCFYIHIILNLRAYVLLKKEFPQVVKHIKTNIKTKQFQLQATIYNLKPIIRFIKGLPNDVTVLEPQELINALKTA